MAPSVTGLLPYVKERRVGQSCDSMVPGIWRVAKLALVANNRSDIRTPFPLL